jgi:PAS domain S-box-containing protein
VPEALVTASGLIAGEPDDARVQRVFVEQVAQALAADDVRLELIDTDPEWMVLCQAVGAGAGRLGERRAGSAGLLGQVVQSGKAWRGEDFASHPLAAAEPDGDGLASVLAVPLRFRGELIGAVRVGRGHGRPAFSTPDEIALQLLADVTAGRLGAREQTAALRARAQELTALAPIWRLPPEQAGDFVVVVDARSRQIVDADEAACRILGYPREVLLQRTIWELIPLPAWSSEVDTLATVREQLMQGHVFSFDSSMRRRDGSVIPTRYQLQGLSSPQGPVIRGVCRDLSAEKRAQVHTLQMEKMRLLQEIGSGLAHQLNTPLALMLGQTEMVLDELQDPELRALLKSARDAAERVATVVRDLQLFARPIVPTAWTSVDLSVLVWETVEQSRSLWESDRPEGQSIEVRLETQPVPPVRANPVELHEALRELLANAVQALPEGGTVVVSTEVQGEQVVLKVADNGVGMSEEVRHRWLEPFFTTRRPLAAGLGLNRVYHIVLRHRGDLQIESAEGQGTRVSISLPVRAPA